MHSLGLKADGSIVAWGDNSAGQTDVPTPNADFIAIAGGFGHNLGLKADGSIVAWGFNNYGQTNVPDPNGSFIAVDAGKFAHSLAIRETIGACCDISGQDQGCRDDVLSLHCSEQDDVWSENVACEDTVCVAVPALGHWGLVLLTLSGLITGTVVFRCKTGKTA